MSYILKIDIMSYWHPGTGRGQGSSQDVVAHRTAHNLPALPGKSVKGLIKDSLRRWCAFQPNNSELATLPLKLFGSDPDASESQAGCLRIDDAELSAQIRSHLLSPKNQALIPGLFRTINETKIEYASGVASDKSLRSIEVVVPMTLYAPLTEISNASQVNNWADTLRDALKLIDAVGAHRSRGLGRCSITLEAL